MFNRLLEIFKFPKSEAHKSHTERLDAMQESLGIDSTHAPSSMLCPLSFEIMNHPVYVDDNFHQTLCRNSLNNWMSKGNATHPMTRKEIVHIHPNKPLSDEISHYVLLLEDIHRAKVSIDELKLAQSGIDANIAQMFPSEEFPDFDKESFKLEQMEEIKSQIQLSQQQLVEAISHYLTYVKDHIETSIDKKDQGDQFEELTDSFVALQQEVRQTLEQQPVAAQPEIVVMPEPRLANPGVIDLSMSIHSHLTGSQHGIIRFGLFGSMIVQRSGLGAAPQAQDVRAPAPGLRPNHDVDID